MAVKILFERKKGYKYEICCWLDSDGGCQVESYIMELYANNNSDSEAMVNRLEQTARFGTPTNEQKFRYLRGDGQGLVEFKARGGTRVLGFIDQDRQRIVCTHAIPKLKEKRFKREVKRAQDIKELYLLDNTPEENNYVH